MRSASLYTGMLAALVAGTWVVLRAGAHLRPALDVSGRWEECADGGRSFEVRQSGLYLRFRPDGGETFALKWRAADEQQNGLLGEMVGSDVRLTLRELDLDGAPGASTPTHELEAHGAIEGSWKVRRSPWDAPHDPGARAGAGEEER